jgi:multicomponent K+:H+ antiporter subunit E
MNMVARMLPHPLLSLLVALVWIGLANTFSLGHVVLGIILGFIVPKLTSAYWPDRPRIKHPLRVAEFVAIVLWDIVVSNISVAYLVLFRKGDSLRSQFVTVPLDIQSPEAITMLAGTITMTPGTLSADLASDGSSILVHCLDVENADDVVRDIKHRYERRLKEIFE